MRQNISIKCFLLGISSKLLSPRRLLNVQNANAVIRHKTINKNRATNSDFRPNRFPVLFNGCAVRRFCSLSLCCVLWRQPDGAHRPSLGKSDLMSYKPITCCISIRDMHYAGSMRVHCVRMQRCALDRCALRRCCRCCCCGC